MAEKLLSIKVLVFMANIGKKKNANFKNMKNILMKLLKDFEKQNTIIAFLLMTFFLLPFPFCLLGSIILTFIFPPFLSEEERKNWEKFIIKKR